MRLNFKAEVNGTRLPDLVSASRERESAYLSLRPVEDRIQRLECNRVTVNKSVALNACMADVKDACGET